MRIGRLTRFNIDTLRRTRSRTKKARSASHRRIFAQRQTMAPAKSIGIMLPLVGILSGVSSVDVLLKPKQMRTMQKQIPHEMIVGDRQPTQKFRDINPLPEGHFLASFHPAPDPFVTAGKFSDAARATAKKIDGRPKPNYKDSQELQSSCSRRACPDLRFTGSSILASSCVSTMPTN